jgi:hypothetical protein
MHRTVVCAALLLALGASPASAGPVEALNGVFINPKNPKSLALRYLNGGGGMLLSDDGGKSFRLLCNTGVDPQVGRDASAMMMRADGSLLLGVFDGLWAGDDNACGWAKVPAFEGQWVDDFTLDPFDPSITYAITSAGGKQNGIYENDGKSAAWTALGTQDAILIGRLHVVALGSGKRRIYESAVRGTYDSVDPTTGQMISDPKYVIRISDDGGKTWTEHEFGHTDGSLRLLAVDPQNPDRIVVTVQRGDSTAPDDMAPDDLLWSATQGSAGSFKLIGQVTQIGGASFAPDGRLFYGDINQSTPALYALGRLGDKPKQLSYPHKAGCVTYDAQTSQLYVCQDRLFGTVDPSTGAFKQLYDLTKASSFVECKGQAPTADRCQEQLIMAFCGITHFPDAPVCAGYGLVTDAGSGGASTRDAAVSSNDAGAVKPATSKSGGGGCTTIALGGRRAPWAVMALTCCVALAALRTRRRAARRSSHV